MRDLNERPAIGGETIRVGDCYIWAEIYDLDSPTDYREYLPNHVSPPSTGTGEDFITLDNAEPLPWTALGRVLTAAARMIRFLARAKKDSSCGG